MEWLGESFIADDTVMQLLLKEMNLRKCFREQGIEHFCIFYCIENPDAVSDKNNAITQLLVSEIKPGLGEAKYVNELLQALISHVEKAIKFEESKND